MRIQNEAPIQTGTNTYSLLLLKFSMRTGAERRHRTFEPWQGSKKRTIPIWYRSFFKRETGIEPATPSLARRCSTTEPLAHNTNIKFAVAYKLAPTNTSISDFNFCVNLFLQISCNFSATFVTNAPPIIKSAFAFIIKNHQKTDRRANPVK